MLPGWYPDQNSPAHETYWDGQRWTGRTRIGGPATAPGARQSQPTQHGYGGPQQQPWAGTQGAGTDAPAGFPSQSSTSAIPTSSASGVAGRGGGSWSVGKVVVAVLFIGIIATWLIVRMTGGTSVPDAVSQASDPTGDVLDERTEQLAAVPFVDITSVSVDRAGDELVIAWTLAGEIPDTLGTASDGLPILASWTVSMVSNSNDGIDSVSADQGQGQRTAIVFGEHPQDLAPPTVVGNRITVRAPISVVDRLGDDCTWTASAGYGEIADGLEGATGEMAFHPCP